MQDIVKSILSQRKTSFIYWVMIVYLSLKKTIEGLSTYGIVNDFPSFVGTIEPRKTLGL
jgi:hypothetical protein